ncbi:Zinc/iron permease [Carpediemonas membranifera]|uniref:Zinc/iron permease n=1 Tax=Carpediemonas membranifera TaxID=201153 RepID=A0A8J6AVU5_9EUKA|nr:Zinc/iron permease [Carpediemonas membranifera]|eukprot:KAG9393785.1 Zinc/iron permease [Carpediemonas membranifera]
MDLLINLIWVVFCCILIYALSLLGGSVPIAFSLLKIKHISLDQLFLHMNLFAAGVFIGGGFLHLLPDCIDDYSGLVAEGSWWHDMPTPEMIAALTCLAMVTIDHLSNAHARMEGHAHEHDHGKHSDDEDEEQALLAVESDSGLDTSSEVGSKASGFKFGITSLFLLLALSFHSFVTGFGLGVNDFASNHGQALAFLIAIVSHKSFEVMALIASIMSHGTSPIIAIVVLLCFGWITPIGIILGTLCHTVAEGKLKDGIVMVGTAASAGTFVYVGVVEMLAESIHKGAGAPFWGKLLHLLFVLVGFGIMSAVLLLPVH